MRSRAGRACGFRFAGAPFALPLPSAQPSSCMIRARENSAIRQQRKLVGGQFSGGAVPFYNKGGTHGVTRPTGQLHQRAGNFARSLVSLRTTASKSDKAFKFAETRLSINNSGTSRAEPPRRR